tara:strand:+ start:83068 stop:83667 length:600 start_codon:yes stop_codon:yes gene_type:complete
MKLPTAYFGNIEFWTTALKNDCFEIEVHESFVKQSFRNKCEILGANGIITLTANVVGRSKGTKTKDVVLDFRENWPQKHLHSIKSAYGHSPYFEYYIDDIEAFYSQIKELNTLSEMNTKSLQLIKNILEIKQDFHLSESFTLPDKSDLISQFKSGKKRLDYTPYYQTFSDRFSFEPNLCILDLVLNSGNETITYLKQQY